MKKTVKKLTAVGLTLTSVMSLVACGNNNGGSNNNTSSNKARQIYSYVRLYSRYRS